MQFNSYLFVLLFLPFVIIVYYRLNRYRKYQPAVLFLLLSSLLFYSNGVPGNLVILLVSILVNYLLYYLFHKLTSLPSHKLLLTLGVVFHLSVLIYYKYYNFFIDNINTFIVKDYSIRELVMPLGISFITFQQIAFLADAYRGETGRVKLSEFALFVSYFPHVSSGPILLHQDLLPQLRSEARKRIDWNQLGQGFYMFIMGLGKKVLIADLFAKAVDWGYGNLSELNSTSAVFVTIAYSIQIYFDFSGYSDMAVGISRMLNLEIPVNFNSPYKAVTILDFWERWHITLTRFLTKYLYIPLGGNRKGKLRTMINTLIVFLCSGLWHGASWTFVVWGFLHGCMMILTKRLKGMTDRIPKIINRVITLLFINFTWILFRSGSFGVFRQMMSALFQNKWGGLNQTICEFFDWFKGHPIPGLSIPYWFWTVISFAIVLFTIFKCKNVQERAARLKYSLQTALWTAAVAVLSILSFSGVSAFVYSNF